MELFAGINFERFIERNFGEIISIFSFFDILNSIRFEGKTQMKTNAQSADWKLEFRKG